MSSAKRKESVFGKIAEDVTKASKARDKKDVSKTSEASTNENHIRDVVVAAYTGDRIMVTEAIVDKTVDYLLRIVRLMCVRIGMSETEFLQKHRNFFMNQERGKKTPAAMYSNRNTYNRLLTRNDGDANEITFTNAKKIIHDIYGLRIDDITFKVFSAALGKSFSVSASDTYKDMIMESQKDKKLGRGIDAEALSKS